MNIVVVGAGMVGQSLAEQLSQEGHSVSVVDSDRYKVSELRERLDVLVIQGHAGNPKTLEKAGIRQSQMMIAVTNVDEINLVSGMLASRMGVEHCIVRLRNPEYLRKPGLLDLSALGIRQVINPDPAMVEALFSMMLIPGCTDYARLAGGQVLLLGFDIAADSPLAGKALKELTDIEQLDAFLVLYLTRAGQVLVPRGDDRIQAGDTVHLMVAADTAHFIPSIVQKEHHPVRSVIIVGASRVGVELARRASEKAEKVTLIESRREPAEEAAAQLSQVNVLRGDPTRLDLLEEANLEGCDLVCAVSDNDETNTLSVLLAKRHSRAATAAMIHNPDYVPVLDSLGVQIVVNPRLVTIGEILMHVRRGHVHSVTRLAESRAEILEMEAQKGSPAVMRPIREIDFPKQALVGAVVKNGVMHIPRGDTQIAPGDVVLVFALPEAIARIEKIFTRRRFL
ncbi:MAG: Trk system potassium transporter TrkA [Myxococcales bacterium]|nr:Trk system potassium transporter TrkA [Myxococcales bacterium]